MNHSDLAAYHCGWLGNFLHNRYTACLVAYRQVLARVTEFNGCHQIVGVWKMVIEPVRSEQTNRANKFEQNTKSFM